MYVTKINTLIKNIFQLIIIEIKVNKPILVTVCLHNDEDEEEEEDDDGDDDDDDNNNNYNNNNNLAQREI